MDSARSLQISAHTESQGKWRIDSENNKEHAELPPADSRFSQPKGP
jgi:hypothetical protein